MYFVKRTKNSSLPVYTDFRNGGTRKLTIIRRIDGDVKSFMQDLQQALYLSAEDISLNRTNNNVIIKGIKLKQVMDWLESRGF